MSDFDHTIVSYDLLQKLVEDREATLTLKDSEVNNN